MGEMIKLKVATSEEVISLKSASGSLAVEAVSPRVNLEKVDGGTRLNIADVEGIKSTIIPDGEKGDPGESYIFDEVPTDNSPNPVRSRGLKSEFDSVRSDIQHCYDSAVEAVLNSEIRLNMKFGQKQDVLTFDEYPTVNSDNPVKSNGVKILIDAIASMIPRHASDLIDDSGHYTKPPQGIPASDLAYGVIPDVSQKQDLLSFDQTPTLQSANPVTSNGIKRAIDIVYNQLSGETDLKLLAKTDRVSECTEGNFAALDENGNLVDSGSKASDFVTDVQVNGASVLSNGVANIPTVTVDSSISSTSDNPVKNKAVAANLQGIRNIIVSVGFEPVASPTSWALGTWSTSTGDSGTNARRIRTVGATQINDLDYYIRSDSGVVFMPLFYDGDTYVPSSSYPWVAECFIADVAPAGATGFRLVARTAPESDLTSLVAETAAQVHFYHGSKQDKLTFDGAPTSESTNPVASGGVYTALQAKADKVNGAIAGNFAALDSTGNLMDSGSKANDFVMSAQLVSSTENGLIKAGGGGAVKTIAGNPGCLYINSPSDSTIKAGTNDNFVAGIGSQHKSVFYGLAKAAGDTTQASSSNAVGTYTENARSKIHELLDAPVTVSGTDPVISAKAGICYVCGTCDTLTLTLPASGSFEVWFTSGTTATVLNANGVTMPDWWAGVESNRTYDLIVTNGYGVVASWSA